MSPEAAVKKQWTPEEYLAFERSSPEKHQFFQGEIFAMAGGSEEHNLLVSNLVTRLNLALERKPCRVYPSDMRVKIPATGLYTYPDVSVTCADRKFDDDRRDTLLNPEVIVEVLSESTELYDRGKKFAQYRTVPSLREYVLVSQDEVLVEQYTRQADETWMLRVHRAGERLRLDAVGCEIAVDEIYLKVFGAE